MIWCISSHCAGAGVPKSHTHMGYSHLLVFDADIVEVDSRAIIRTLNAAGSQSNILCKTGCSLKWSMSVIIKVRLHTQSGGNRSGNYLNTQSHLETWYWVEILRSGTVTHSTFNDRLNRPSALPASRTSLTGERTARMLHAAK